MSRGLPPHVFDCPPEVTNTEGPEIVSVSPLETRTWHNAVAVRYASTRSFQSLEQARSIEASGKLEHKVYVVLYHTEFDHTHTVTSGDLRQNSAEKCGRL